MDVLLNEAEARVLGALVEKERTTPEYYPLSLNSLTSACNQKSNRNPVVSYTEADVTRALDGLRDKHLIWVVGRSEGRVLRYRHRLSEALDLSPEETALLCLLLLRGPQTAGELRGRTERLVSFSSIEEVDACLEELAKREESPLALKLQRLPGHKEHRYTHLLCGRPPETLEARAETSLHDREGSETRIEALEREVRGLRTAIEELRDRFSAFQKQFE